MCDCEGSTPPTTPPTRRTMLFKLGNWLMAIGATLATLPIIGFVFAPLVRRSRTGWVDLGDVASFPEGETRMATYVNPTKTPWDGDAADIPCWVRHTRGGRFQVFAVNCTHLGCPVKWFRESRLFLCPCHGGAYYEDGARASGPPPRALFEYTNKVVNGRLEIDAGRLPTLQEPASA